MLCDHVNTFPSAKLRAVQSSWGVQYLDARLPQQAEVVPHVHHHMATWILVYCSPAGFHPREEGAAARHWWPTVVLQCYSQ
jgi:hypothetical protein